MYGGSLLLLVLILGAIAGSAERAAGQSPAGSSALTVTKAGAGTGRVTSNDGRIDCGATCSAIYSFSSPTVSLTATPDPGMLFIGWSGACSGTGVCQWTAGPCSQFGCLGPTATFQPAVTVTVTRTGRGRGAITSEPAGIACGATCSGIFPGGGTSLTFRATANAGSAFLGWSGACSGRGACTVGLTGNTSLVARFGWAPPSDFDGDGVSDIGVYRKSTGEWLIRRSSDTGLTQLAWGSPFLDDVPVPGDYDGDGKTDIAVYRRSTGVWFILPTSTGALVQLAWGSPFLGDVPAAGDYDGDGATDIAVYRTSTGEWFIRPTSLGILVQLAWGSPFLGDVPAAGDYDGDGATDIAVYRTSTGEWFIRPTSNPTLVQVGWGAPSLADLPVPGDYDGDGATDIAVYRRTTGEWFIRRASDGTLVQIAWGSPLLNDVPAPGDYDGDGATDVAIYRQITGEWFVRRSSDGALQKVAWGAPSLRDVPQRFPFSPAGPRLTFNPPAEFTVTAGTHATFVLCRPHPGDFTVQCPVPGTTGDPSGGVPPYHFQLETFGGFPPIWCLLGKDGQIICDPPISAPPQRVTFIVCVIDLVGDSVCRAITIVILAAPPAPPPPPPPPPDPGVIRVTVTGNGRVTDNVGRIDCPGRCEAAYGGGDFPIFSARPGAGAAFLGWQTTPRVGSCSGTLACVLVPGDYANGLAITAPFR